MAGKGILCATRKLPASCLLRRYLCNLVALSNIESESVTNLRQA